MGDNNAVYGTESSTDQVLTSSQSDVELVVEPKYVSLDSLETLIILPDESQYIVVTKIRYGIKTGICTFFLHGGEATPVQVGPKVTGPASTSDVLDVFLKFPLGAPVKASVAVAAGAELTLGVEYHIVQTQNRIPTRNAYAEP